MNEGRRDHLFISYAWEDGDLAEWLSLKLTAEGYKVWCDRFKLLGGESYPEDIDRAIKEETFRVLALLSKHSLHKPNPLKERTLALNLGRERGEDFMIPLNVDDLRPIDLPWMLSDITYIPFQPSWAEGLAQLLRKLQVLGTPQPLSHGRQIVSDWFAERDSVNETPERLWTNLLEFHELPSTLLRIRLAEALPQSVALNWPHYPESKFVVWAFEGPGLCDALDLLEIEEVSWEHPCESTGLKLSDVVTNLLKQHLRTHCLRKGLLETLDRQYLYFPPGLLPNDRLVFMRYDGARTWVKAVGERSFRIGPTQREKTRYHLSPMLRPNLWKYERPVVQVHMRVHLTDAQEKPLDPRKAARRRKKICRNWWNYEWLARVLGFAEWIADGGRSVSIARAPGRCITLAGRPIHLEAPVGIDESALASLAWPDDDDIEVSDDESEGLDQAGSVFGEDLADE